MRFYIARENPDGSMLYLESGYIAPNQPVVWTANHARGVRFFSEEGNEFAAADLAESVARRINSERTNGEPDAVVWVEDVEPNGQVCDGLRRFVVENYPKGTDPLSVIHNCSKEVH